MKNIAFKTYVTNMSNKFQEYLYGQSHKIVKVLLEQISGKFSNEIM